VGVNVVVNVALAGSIVAVGEGVSVSVGVGLSVAVYVRWAISSRFKSGVDVDVAVAVGGDSWSGKATFAQAELNTKHNSGKNTILRVINFSEFVTITAMQDCCQSNSLWVLWH